MAGGWGFALMLMCFEDVLDLLAKRRRHWQFL